MLRRSLRCTRTYTVCPYTMFLRAFTSTVQAILMVRRCVADLWRTVAAGGTETVNWADLYKTLLAELAGLVAQGELQDAELRARIVALLSARDRKSTRLNSSH